MAYLALVAHQGGQVPLVIQELLASVGYRVGVANQANPASLALVELQVNLAQAELAASAEYLVFQE